MDFTTEQLNQLVDGEIERQAQADKEFWGFMDDLCDSVGVPHIERDDK